MQLGGKLRRIGELSSNIGEKDPYGEILVLPITKYALTSLIAISMISNWEDSVKEQVNYPWFHHKSNLS